MAKELHCTDVGFDCDFVARGQTDQEILAQVIDHAGKAHPNLELTDELVVDVKDEIRDR